MDLNGKFRECGPKPLSVNLILGPTSLRVSKLQSTGTLKFWHYRICLLPILLIRVCMSRCESLQSLWKDFLFSAQQSTVNISLLYLCPINIFVSMTGFCRASWKAFCVCLQNMPSVGLEDSDCGCKGSCSLFLHFYPTAISCDAVYNRCCLILAMLCGSFVTAFVGNCKFWKYLFWVSVVYITKNCETKSNAWCGEEGKGLKDMNVFLCWQ